MSNQPSLGGQENHSSDWQCQPCLYVLEDNQMYRGTVSEGKANQQDPGGTLGILLLVRLAREIAEALKNSLPCEIHLLRCDKSSREKFVLLICHANHSEVAGVQCLLGCRAWRGFSPTCLPTQRARSHFLPPSHLVGCQRCRQHVPLLPEARLPPCSRSVHVLTFPELASALVLDPSWPAPYVPQQTELCIR